MKRILIIAVVLFSINSIAQSKEKPFAVYDTTNAKITALTFSVNSSKELETINWDDLKELFQSNRNPGQEISLTFEFELPDSKNKLSGEFKIHGTNKDIDALIVKARKGVQGLIKIIHNNNK